MEYVCTNYFGRARVTVVSEGLGAVPMNFILEEVPEEQWSELVPTDKGHLLIDFNLAHIDLDGASLLLDTGFGDHGPTDPMRTLSPGAIEGLRSIGVQPEDVTHVLLSHLHSDHMVGATRLLEGEMAPAFPNARYYVMADEWLSAPESWQPAKTIVSRMQALECAGVVELVHDECEIVPGVLYKTAPGETPGHAIVRVEADGPVVYYLGDLFHVPAEFAHPEWGPPHRNRSQLTETRRYWLERFADEEAWLIVSHHRFPGMGRVVRTNDGFCWMDGAPL